MPATGRPSGGVKLIEKVRALPATAEHGATDIFRVVVVVEATRVVGVEMASQKRALRDR